MMPEDGSPQGFTTSAEPVRDILSSEAETVIIGGNQAMPDANAVQRGGTCPEHVDLCERITGNEALSKFIKEGFDDLKKKLDQYANGKVQIQLHMKDLSRDVTVLALKVSAVVSLVLGLVVTVVAPILVNVLSKIF